MPIISARRLAKRFRVSVKEPGLGGAVRHLFSPRYEEKLAVDAIDLNVEAGESIAYVGPNGAGKSTTVKMLSGILVPTSGELQVMGLVPHRNRIENARNIGVVFGQRTQLWWDLPVQESLRLLGDIYQVPEKVFERNLKTFDDLLQLGPLLPVPARHLSLGQRMRCDLAAALLHDPAILYLDEPTIGLDVAAKDRIRQFIKTINSEKEVTFILTSHDLGDIESLCRRMIVLDRGRFLYDGPLEAVRERFGRERVIHLVLQQTRSDAVSRCRAALSELAPVSIEQPDAHHLRVHFDATETTAATLVSRLLPMLPVTDLQIEEPSIESIIRRVYEGEFVFDEALERGVLEDAQLEGALIEGAG